MNHKLPRPLRGVITAMVTPLDQDLNLDQKGLEQLVEHLIAGGVHGIFILGTTGEAPNLPYDRALCGDRANLQAGRLPGAGDRRHHRHFVQGRNPDGGQVL